MEAENNVLKTGTTTLGIICKDGIVLAADKRATSGNYIVDRRAEKLHFITEDIAVSMAGTVSDAQLMVKLAQAELKLKKFRTTTDVTVREAATYLSRLVYQNIRRSYIILGVSHFVMAGRDQTGMYLYDVYADGSLTEIKDFVSSGSGSVMAYGLLETLYSPNMTVEQGTKLAVQCVNAALARDSASGDGIDIITVTEKGALRTVQKEIRKQIEL
jgi:proteasome beta subunit